MRRTKSEPFGKPNSSAVPKASISKNRIRPLTQKQAVRQAELLRWAKNKAFGEPNSPADPKASSSTSRIPPLSKMPPHSLHRIEQRFQPSEVAFAAHGVESDMRFVI